MTTHASLTSVAALVAAMALLAALETLLPLAGERARRRSHAFPNLALTGLTLGLNLACNAGAVLLVGWSTSRGFGLLAGSALPPLAFVLIGLLALDASTYASHRLLHRLAPLWSVHRVHHSDPLVDVTTSLRQHPIEGLWRFLFLLAPAAALGLPMEAVAVHRAASGLQALLEHVNVKLWEPLDRALTWLTCTPNMHKLHHSRRQHETDSNYGNLFSLFDRVFGTFRPAAPGARVAYGLEGLDAPETQRLGALLRLPFRGWPQRGRGPGMREPEARMSR